MPKIATPIPAYIPWTTFADFMSHLEAAGVPSRIDKSVMAHLPPLTSGQILTTLKFLRLIDNDGSTASGHLQKLAGAFGTEQWAGALKELVVPRYESIIGELDLESATPHQLNECFDKVCDKEQMRSKSERFYLTVLTEAGVAFSPHLLKKAPSNGGARKKAPRKKRPSTAGKRAERWKAPEPDDPSGTHRYPLYFKGKPDGALIVPNELSESDCKVIELQLAVLKAYAESE